MTPRRRASHQALRDQGDCETHDVRAHVQRVGKQSQRVKREATDNLDDHEGTVRGQRDPECPPPRGTPTRVHVTSHEHRRATHVRKRR